MTILHGAMATHSIEKELETFYLTNTTWRSKNGIETNKTRHIITLTTGQYDHLYNIMCSQDEIIDYLNESDDFDPQTFDNLFDAICAAKETYLP